MAQVGDALRAARESRGLTLEQVEQTTRIRRVFLEALEEDRFDELPAPVYTRGFIRNYARLLGLDPDDMVAAYAAATGTPAPGPAPEVLDEPLLQQTGGSPVVGVFWGIVIVLIIAAAGWYAYMRFYLGETPTLPSLPFLAPRGSSVIETPEPTIATPRVVVIVPAETEVAEPTDTPSPTSEPEPTATPTLRAVIVEPTSTPTEVPPSPTPTQATGVTVEATVTAATYLEVTADGVRLLTATLQAGDDRTWTGERSVALRVGNAGGIELKVNGVEVPSLGGAGEVVNVEYTIDSLPRG